MCTNHCVQIWETGELVNTGCEHDANVEAQLLFGGTCSEESSSCCTTYTVSSIMSSLKLAFVTLIDIDTYEVGVLKN